jgi:hypothetical protein
LYAADDQDGYQFGFYQDNPDLGTGNRASAILPERQLAFSGMHQVNGQRVLSLIFSAPGLNVSYNTDTSNIYCLLDGQSFRNITQLNYTFGAVGSYEISAVVQTSCGRDTMCQTLGLLTTSLPAVRPDPSLLIWPVPASDILILEWPDHRLEQVQVFNVTGKLISLSAKGNADQWEIDVRSLPGGLYHLLVHSEEGAIASKRIVVSN